MFLSSTCSDPNHWKSQVLWWTWFLWATELHWFQEPSQHTRDTHMLLHHHQHTRTRSNKHTQTGSVRLSHIHTHTHTVVYLDCHTHTHTHTHTQWFNQTQSHTQTLSCCCKHLLKHQICINPLLKIVPDTTVSSCLFNKYSTVNKVNCCHRKNIETF